MQPIDLTQTYFLICPNCWFPTDFMPELEKFLIPQLPLKPQGTGHYIISPLLQGASARRTWVSMCKRETDPDRKAPSQEENWHLDKCRHPRPKKKIYWKSMASCWAMKAEVRETIDLPHIPSRKISWPVNTEKRKHNKILLSCSFPSRAVWLGVTNRQ